MKKLALLIALCSLSTLSLHSQQTSHFDGTTWWGYVKVLADDNMEGRETGSPGLQRAEAYVIEQLKKNGLEPAGAGGFYQPVKFESREIVEKECSLALVKNGKRETLVLGEDAIFSTRIDPAPSVEAPLVFVGYGMNVPEANYNDFTGLDLKGKIAVVLAGSPSAIPGPLASHYQTAGERWKTLQSVGAIGMVTILNPSSMDIPWSRISANRTHPSMSLVGREFDETAGQKLSVTINPAQAEKLFAGSGHKFSELLEAAKDRQQLPRFPLAVSMAAKTKMIKQPVESANIVARLAGSDPALKDQYVVLSAHIDHVGIGAPIDGDSIYNGAMDNASGSAVLLDVAASLKKSPEALKRSLLFVFVTGEEKGLLGSRYFTQHPTVKAGAMVANINIDMFLPIVPLKVLTVHGLNESDVGDMARATAESLGVKVQVDPEPQRNSFIRSDQYNFIRHGIPAVAMAVGYIKDSSEQSLFKEWRTKRYHAPSDDLNQPVELSAAAR
ncbi:MAG TPA: M28 family metallopeptidase, partial [Candidatus Saccharimonadales bacterium]|nr:M28 family metallopeptidase [Candidatus Saccharimonadales bacterium]